MAAENFLLPPEVFLDTSFVVALTVPDDENHAIARSLSRAVRNSDVLLVTTEAILLEVGNMFSKQHLRPAAVTLNAALRDDPRVTILPLAGELLARAWHLFRSRPDKDWGVIDCLSFTVMIDLGITAALTADSHFKQAGFRALLLPNEA